MPPVSNRVLVVSVGLAVVVVVFLAAIGVFSPAPGPDPDAADDSAVPPASSPAVSPESRSDAPAAVDARASNRLTLPFVRSMVAPAAVVREAYDFAAGRPDVLDYVPCFCGCSIDHDHGSSSDCFVAARDAAGAVARWEPHGMT